MRFYLLLLFIATTLSGYAKNITGTVNDSHGNPIQFANVVLLNDSIFVDGGITDDNGVFSISTSANNVNTVKVSFLGFNDYLSTIPQNGDCGKIILVENTVMLQEVVVKGTLPATRLAGNSMITNVSNSILSSVGNANDVLSKIPLVTGSNGNFTVFGRGTPSIYINGRLVKESSELEQLNSNDIKSVEVISNPGSKYSTETKAVIIIKTLPPKGDGFSLSLSTYNRIAHFINNTDNALFKYRRNGLEIFANVYFNVGKQKFNDINSFTTYGEDMMFQNIKSDNIYSKHHISSKFGFNQQINTEHSFGAYYQYGFMKTNSKGKSLSEIFSDKERFQYLDLESNGVEKGRPIHEANMYYTGRAGNLSIDFNTDYMQINKLNESSQSETSDDSDNKIVETYANNKSRLWAEKLVLSLPVWKGTIEFGEEFTNSFVNFNSNYKGTDISGGDTKIKENNISAFVQVSQSFGLFQVGAGLRFEHANYKYYDDDQLNIELSKNYNNWYPSLFMSTNIKNVGLSCNLTSRTRRPSYRQLDGTLQYINRYSYQQGNPSLKPVKSYTVQLLAQWKYFFAQTVYTHERNSIFYTTERFNNDPIIKLIIFENVPKYQQFQFVIGAQPTISHWYPQISTGIFNSFYKTTFREKQINLNKPFFFINWDNSISLPKGWIIDVDFMAQTSGDGQNCHIKSVSYLNVGVRKSFFNNSLNVLLKANDIFNTNNEKVTMYHDDIKVGTSNFQESRNVMITFQYNFNVSRTKYKGTGAGQEEKNRF